ncbi:MAG TPA: hypothetical protein VFW28_07250 [Micropepsaceae bacterium]|nr:hypothetical protein [Micropepsaceae bacterium]
MIVGYIAGGGCDLYARLLAKHLGHIQPVSGAEIDTVITSLHATPGEMSSRAENSS